MKILGISGSPIKNGSNEKAIDFALEIAKEKGFSVEKIFLSQYNIKSCIGCNLCKKQPKCSIDDDMNKLYDGPKQNTMNVNNIAIHGVSYSVNKTQKSEIPNDVMMLMDLGHDRKYAKLTNLTKKPHITKNVDFNKGRDDPVKYDPFAIENKRKPERDEGVSIHYTLLFITEKKESPIVLNQA